MNTDREAIAATLASAMPDWVNSAGGDAIADALADTVRRLIADELLHAADEQNAEARRVQIGKGSHAGGHDCAADHLRVRASEVLA